jgi:hypothetical protein
LYPIHHFMLPLFYFPFLFSAQNWCCSIWWLISLY